MTGYFDSMRDRVRVTELYPEGKRAEALEPIEREMVEEVTLSAEHPTMPAAYRRAIHAAILKWGVTTLPREAPVFDYELDAQYADRLLHLESDLHSIFHGLASSDSPGWGDSPTGGRRKVLDSGEEYRERLFRGEDPTGDPFPGEVVSVRKLKLSVLAKLGDLHRLECLQPPQRYCPLSDLLMYDPAPAGPLTAPALVHKLMRDGKLPESDYLLVNDLPRNATT